MSRFLDSVISEMNNYADMGMPDGEGSMGMGSAPTGKLKDAYKMKQLKVNNMLRNRNAAEEEEMDAAMGDMDAAMGDDMGSMDDMGGEDEMSMDMDGGDGGGMFGDMEGGAGEPSDELKQFFTDNPSPSDEEISQYAQEKGIDMQGMRTAVYDLIQSLMGSDGGEDYEFGELGDEEGTDDEMSMGDEEGMDDEMSMGDEGGEGDDEMNFSVPGDTGERPPKKEFEERIYGRRRSDRRRS